MTQSHPELLIPLLILVPALMVGGFEYFRHELLIDLPMRTGNLLAAGVAVIGSLIYYLALYRHIRGLVRQAEQERLERTIRDRQAEIAEDLHDEILQNLFFINVQVGEIKAHAAAVDLAGTQRALETVHTAIQETHERMRRTIEALEQVGHDRPSDLPGQRDDWLSTLLGSIRRWREQSGIPVTTRTDDALKAVHMTDREAEAIDSLIGQALQNVQKHAGATRVDVRGELCDGYMQWTIADDGRGFDVQAASPQFGFRQMRRYEREFGIQVRVESAVGSGTRVTLRVPVQGSKD